MERSWRSQAGMPCSEVERSRSLSNLCNRFVQKGREVKPGQKVTVLMRGPAGEFEVPYEEAVFGGPARNESRR